MAPTSVVPNWAAESARFAPGLKVVTITDTLARSGADLAEVVAAAGTWGDAADPNAAGTTVPHPATYTTVTWGSSWKNGP